MNFSECRQAVRHGGTGGEADLEILPRHARCKPTQNARDADPHAVYAGISSAGPQISNDAIDPLGGP